MLSDDVSFLMMNWFPIISSLSYSSPLSDKQFSYILIEFGTTLGESHGYGFLRFKFLTSLSSVIIFNALMKLKIEENVFLMIRFVTFGLRMIQLISIPLTLLY